MTDDQQNLRDSILAGIIWLILIAAIASYATC